EDRAAIGHRCVEEQSKELSGQVVVMAYGARVAFAAVPRSAGPELDRWRRRRHGQPAATSCRERESRAARGREAGWLPCVEHAERGVEIVELQLPGHICAAEAKLTGSS